MALRTTALTSGNALTAAALQAARLVRITGDPTVNSLQIEIGWPDCDATSVGGFVAELIALTSPLTNPKINGAAYTGSFVVSAVPGSEDQARTGDVRLALTKVTPYVIASYDTAAEFVALTNTSTQKNEIIEAFDAATGEGDEVAYVWKNLEPSTAWATVFFGYADADLVAALNAGWTYIDRSWKYEENGTATATVLLRKVAFTAWASANAADLDEYEAQDSSHIIRRQTWLKLDIDDYATAITEAEDATAALPSALNGKAYYVLGVSGNDRRDGSFDLIRRIRVVKNQTATSYSNSPLRDVTTMTNTEGTALTDPGDQAAGGRTTHENTPTAAGNTRTAQRIEVANAKSLEGQQSGGGPHEALTTDFYANQESISINPGSDGQIVSVSARMNEYQRIDASVTTRTGVAKNTEALAAGGGPQESSTWQAFTNADSFTVTPGTATIKGVSARLNSKNKIDYSVQESTPVADDSGALALSNNAAYSDSVRVYKNNDSVTATEVPTAAAGQIISASAGFNRYGKFDITVTTRTVKDLSISAYTAVKTPTQTVTREIFQNRATAPELTEDYGSLSYRKNAAQRYDGEKTVVTYRNSGVWAGNSGTLKKYVDGSTGDIEFTYETKYFTNSAAAWAEISGGYEGSKVSEIVRGKIWMSYKITI